MVIRLTMVKSRLWFCVILLLALSFPLQVYFNSPYPSLLPYFLIMLIILLRLLSSKKKSSKFSFSQNHNINLMVGIYLFLVIFHTAWQTIFAVISIIDAMNALAIYLLPIIFYWYFRRIASEQEIRWCLLAMAAAGLIVGIYFAYDSYMKLALGQVSDYAKAAFQYSLDRSSGNIEEANDARINLGSRSFGLLQSHTVSGAWVALGAFAALAIIPVNCMFFRWVTIAAFGVMLLLGLNFTSIIAFIIIVFLVEFGGIPLFLGRLSGKLVSFFFVLAIMAGAIYLMAGVSLKETMMAIFFIQKDLLFSTGDGNTSFLGLAIATTEHYWRHILDSPFTLLTGDGFSTFGFAKGGDIGALESLAQFGLPFYLAILLGFFSLIMSGLRRIKVKTELDHPRIIQFAICVILLILIEDGHYSVWTAKSILPIVFFALAIFSRYLSDTNRRRYQSGDQSGHTAIHGGKQ